MSSDSSGDCSVRHVVVVDFHYQNGCQIDYSFPEIESDKIATIWRFLPHLSIPDGAHKTEEGSVFFTIPTSVEHPFGGKRIFGISYYRQIDANEVPLEDRKTPRSTILKAVVVLIDQPYFGFIHAKLVAITKAYFDSKDFSNKEIIKEFYDSLSVSSIKREELHFYHIGINLSHLIKKFRHKILLIFKLLLLEQKVLFYGASAERVCFTFLSFLSIYPGLLSQELSFSQSSEPKDDMGFPLSLFSNECVFEPYLPLQQLESLTLGKYKGYLVGATNPLMRHKTDWIDAVVDVEECSLTLTSSYLTSVLSSTVADERFSQYLIDHVAPDIETQDERTQWEGSEEWIRAQFKLYLVSLFCCSLCQGSALWADFNDDYVVMLRSTQHYSKWKEKGQPGMTEIEPQHPFHGQMSPSDVGRRVAKFVGLNDVQASQIVADANRAMKTVKETMGSLWSTAKSWFNQDDEDSEEKNTD
ncbi:late secretory pathway protein AVL9 homolog isoform X1 [Oscarella lobularis]|uniref:late secretory pathway protein AVL9 homolog isoform X1 n=1 Tax=Oscarella lobularis TaxID=121494 RepID=UPI0033143CC3